MANTRILIAANDTDIAQDLRGRLVKLGYVVLGCVTSKQGLVAKAQELDPDLILVDLHLTGKGQGIDTGALNRSNIKKPVIYISGSIGQNTIQRSQSAGPFGYIFTPFDDKQIYAMIETALLRHHMEGELREGRRWLHAVLDGIHDGVIALNPQGEIRFINPIARQLTGWSEAETWNKTIDDVFVLLDEASGQKVQVLEIDRPVEPEAGESRVEGLLVSKDGRKTPVEADLTFIEEIGGLPAGTVLVFRDIARRREAVEEIQRQHHRAESLVQAAARLNAQLELSTLLDAISTICNQALKASATAVYLNGRSPDAYEIRAVSTESMDVSKFAPKDFPLGASLIKAIISQEKPVVIIQDAQTFSGTPYLNLFREQNIHTVGMAGMYRHEELIGLLVSIYVGEPILLAEDTRVLLKGLADQAAIAITNASLFEQVRSSREQQKALTTRMVDLQETERRHLARDLHDQIGQVLTGLQFMLESAKNQRGRAQTDQLGEAQETLSGLIEQIREMSLNLRPSMLDDIGLLPTLIWHFERYTRQTGIKVSFNHFGVNQRLSPNMETTVYRIVQEALTNVARYAQVSEAFVYLVLREKVLGIEIIDHGVGFDPHLEAAKPATAGLAGMRERANLMGGYLVVKSAPKKGTQIKVLLPVDSRPVERRNRARHADPG